MVEPTKTAVVTGGSTGIGAAICKRLLESDYTVISLARRAPDFAHERLHHTSVDLADKDATDTVAADIAQEFAVTNLVHNAGVIRAALIEEVERADLDYLAALHLGAALTLAQAFLPAMKAAEFGRIINISSRAALGLETRTSYSATKSGMLGMTRTWALELGRHGITVNAVAPGPIAATEMFHEVIPEGSEKMKALADSIPVKRVGRPEDVAHAVAFLMSEEAGFITGQTLFVCGGASLGSLSL